MVQEGTERSESNNLILKISRSLACFLQHSRVGYIYRDAVEESEERMHACYHVFLLRLCLQVGRWCSYIQNKKNYSASRIDPMYSSDFLLRG